MIGETKTKKKTLSRFYFILVWDQHTIEPYAKQDAQQLANVSSIVRWAYTNMRPSYTLG